MIKIRVQYTQLDARIGKIKMLPRPERKERSSIKSQATNREQVCYMKEGNIKQKRKKSKSLQLYTEDTISKSPLEREQNHSISLVCLSSYYFELFSVIVLFYAPPREFEVCMPLERNQEANIMATIPMK